MSTTPTFSVLGPLRAHLAGTEIDLGPVRQQAVLAVLLFNANHIVTPEEILRAAWGQDRPSSGTKLIPPYIYRLRRLPSPAPGSPTDPMITTSRQGYLLRLGPGHLDLERFHDGLREAAKAEAEGNLELASSALSSALGHWRGEPLVGVPGPFVDGQRRHLTEHRLSVIERRIEIDLRLGRHDAVVPELTSLSAAHPLREHLAALLMTALFRCHRQADALAVFARTRGVLVEQLGMEPGAELRAAHEAVLRADAGVAAPGGTVSIVRGGSAPGRTHGTGTGRCDTPHVAAAFVGRGGELDALTDATRPDLDTGLSRGTVVDVIDGMLGSGKTALAVQAARLLAPGYPDGQLFIDLHGYTPGRDPLSPDVALSMLLRAVGVPGTEALSQDEREGLWRATLADRRTLVLLDNIADTHQIRPLIPGGPHCRVIITSRQRLVGVETTTAVSLDVLPPADSIKLFATAAGRGRIGDAADLLPEAVELCGRLPLAIRIAADRLTHHPCWSLRDLVDRLRDPVDRLRFLRAGDRDVGDAFLQSYAKLPEQQKSILRALSSSVHEEFDIRRAAALAGLSPQDVQGDLEDLVNLHLVQQPQPGVFRFHTLVRACARMAGAVGTADRP